MSMLGTAHLEQRIDRQGRSRVYLTGTRLRVQDIAAEHEFQGLTPEQIVREFPQLTLGQVHAALSYYFDQRAAILDEMRADAAQAESRRSALDKRE